MLSIFFLFFFAIASNNILAETTTTYVVHMDVESMPTPFTSHHAWYTSILASSLDEGAELLYTYSKAAHGFSARLSPTQLKSLENHPSFLFASRDNPLKLATSRSSDFLGLSSFSGAWNVTNFGRGVIIGVVDTGIWPESASFRDEGMEEIPKKWKGGCYGGTGFNSSMCNKKLVGVRLFNKGVKASSSNITFVNSGRDYMGHGTHVASTAAGNYVNGASFFGYATGTTKGMAPGAHLAIYKVGFTRSTSLYPSDVIAAIDSAIEDGVDIISLSIASSPPLHHDPVAISTFSAMTNGIFVSSAAGNYGPSLQSIPNGAPWVLSVAAGKIDRAFIGTVALGNGAHVTGTSLSWLSKTPPPNLPIVYKKTCDELVDTKDAIVVCPTNDSGIVYSFEGSAVAGAVLIWNATNLPDLPDEAIIFPAVFVSSGNGKTISDYIKANQNAATATLLFVETNHGTKPAPKVASFSSRGPSPTCPFILKPDVLAPGYNILASWTEASPVIRLETGGIILNSFNIDSGTSMASPHVAGVGALVKAAHPDWSPAAIKSAIMTTADVLDNTMGPIQEEGSNQIATPLAIGSGHINPNRALSPGLVYDVSVEDYVNFLCAMNLTSKQIRAITRSKSGCTSPSLDLNYPGFIAYFNCTGTKSVTFQRTLTNVGDDLSIYAVKLAGLEPFNVSVIPQKLVYAKKGEKLSYNLTIYGPCLNDETIIHGSISWLQVGGKGSVASPIVAGGFTPCRDQCN